MAAKKPAASDRAVPSAYFMCVWRARS